MLEEGKSYTYQEMSAIFGTRDTQGIKRRFDNTYHIEYTTSGRGSGLVFYLHTIKRKFRLYCVLNLGFSPNSNFDKLRDFFIYLFNDPDFVWRPMEMMEEYLRKEEKGISRATISNYLKTLEKDNLFGRNGEMVYYKVSKNYGEQRAELITREEYSAGWKTYWDMKAKGYNSNAAYSCMRNLHGGSMRKQPKIERNAFFEDEYQRIQDYIEDSFQAEDRL
jgi:hypothetical protein